MGLIDRLHGQGEKPPAAVQPSLLSEQRAEPSGVGVNPELFQDLKRRVQERLLRNIDVSKLEEAGYGPLLAEITAVINSLIEEDHLLITEADRARLVEVTTNDMLGLGPLEPLLQDNEVSDILVNGYNQVWIERRGKLFKTSVRFQNDAHLMSVINRIVSRIGRRIDESSPMVDARLPDGSRVHAIIPPLAIDGPGLCIRRFGGHSYRMDDLITNGTLPRDMAEFARLAILTRLNILISGGTGSGKTTLLNCLSSYLPENQRIITIEDAAELALQQPHVFRLETRPPNIEGKGEVTQRELFRNTLRMRPDRVIVGEVRGAEVLDMLQAMSTGHDGSMATIHANNPRDSLGRLEMMMLLSGGQPAGEGDAPIRQRRAQRHHPNRALLRRLAQGDQDHRDHRDGRRHRADPGPVRIRAHRGRRPRHRAGILSRHRHALDLRRTHGDRGLSYPT
jgi:pilus assembly protein CpaF